MTTSLIKLIDGSLLPGAFLILGKFFGIALTIQIFNLPVILKDYIDQIFSPKGYYLEESGVLVLSSYSDLFMYIFVAIGLSFAIIRVSFFSTAKVQPFLVAKLSRFNLLGLIKSTYETYQNAAIWLFFTWVCNIIILINTINQTTFVWVGISVTLASITFTTIILQDVYKEIENIRKHPGKYKWQ